MTTPVKPASVKESQARTKAKKTSVNSKPTKADVADKAKGQDACNTLAACMQRNVSNGLSRDLHDKQELFMALALSVKEQMLLPWRATRQADCQFERKQVAYLSLEFLMGRAMGNAIMNLDMLQETKETLQEYAVELEDIEQIEHDAGLGNGGLGRLAACFLDSCASLDLSVTGYGIRYEYGMFAQKLVDGFQVERPDRWLRQGNPWEVRVAEHNVTVPFFGQTSSYVDPNGRTNVVWVGTQDVLAVAYDMPVPGYQNGRVNTLRLWKSEATDDFDLEEFNQGDYAEAVATKNMAEQITMVLYPNDVSENGKELRLRQQYFLSSASLQDLLRTWVQRKGNDFSEFAKYNVMQLNDTHPSIAIPELMRLLVDEHFLEWDDAWQVVTQTMAYTNHTLLPEALERWPVRMLGHMLPRILEIIYEINARYLEQVAHHWPGEPQKLTQMSIIEEGNEPHVRMAYLAIVASFSVNGVAGLHSQLLISGLFKDFYAMWPEKFNNKTNGVTPRRWLAHCNPGLAQLLRKRLGNEWVTDLSHLNALNAFTDDMAFIKEWQLVKQQNKAALAELIKLECDVEFDVDMLFDVQVKRIHEYKRQLLNILHVIHLYHQIQQGHTADIVPRCVLIGGKAAPGYAMAKLVIKLASNVAHMVNSDPEVSKYLRFAFLPNYNVSAMEKICPATDLSEQISTAGKEASGTGNMKFMMNGAITIGTLDGANVEMLEEVGEDNFFLFGLNAQQVVEQRQNYQPQQFINDSAALTQVLELINSGHFSLLEPGIFSPIVDSITSCDDPWMTAADFESFRLAQQSVAKAYRNPTSWTQMSIRNTAASGRFSSDVTIAGYRDEIWGA
ncbi:MULTISPECIES: glycogen/starch/alpha-glucan phosphorylase [unclassified Shewanella]|uniref:glycogen/starch/alpha-glucan phosphorylase n=1 Tax=unclassified Shewanella TaxID=196818 RepID=UPI001BC0B0DE|nr:MULTISPECIES: glycogen/starch/alpha-glucan phosphorylase [unclassified Shewanella]GIU09242.1 alpha-1,4 glucan phosphorylase [Shewanella sp. MBTL60-112-B1]GIU29111.1 alpha-1,4 glucan phosphorylase [Shewanella sp. MBTL60-112-B2]